MTSQNMILGFIAIVLLIVLTFVWPPDSPWSPWWRTSKKVARAAGRLAEITNKDTVYELGSGDGEFILTASREFHAKKSIGIEIDLTRYLISIIKNQLSKNNNAEFVRGDFKQVSLSEATVVYLYLVPSVIKKLMPKLKNELKKGTRIVSLKYEVPLIPVKKDVKNKLYLYKV